MNLYKTLIVTCNTTTIELVQRTRNLQIIIGVLVYTRIGIDKMSEKATSTNFVFPQPCNIILVQTILHDHLHNAPFTPPITNIIVTIRQLQVPYENDMCTLYTSTNMNRYTIKDRSLFYLVCQLFIHIVKNTHHLEKVLKIHFRLQAVLVSYTHLPDT